MNKEFHNGPLPQLDASITKWRLSEDPEIGVDGSEVVWFSELTADMVSKLSESEQEDLFEQLNDAVMETCDIYKVGESFTNDLGRWLTYVYVCDPEGDDSMLEVTTHVSITQPLCPVCDKPMNLITIKNGERIKGPVEEYMNFLKVSGETGI